MGCGSMMKKNGWQKSLPRGTRRRVLICLALLTGTMIITVRMCNVSIVYEEESPFKHYVTITKNDTVKNSEPEQLRSDETKATLQYTIVNTPKEKEARHAICMASGRLGNLMFSYASVYGIAARNNMSVAIDINNPLLKVFNLNAHILRIKGLKDVATLQENRSCDYSEEVTKLNPEKDVLIKRYLQSWKYFFHVEDAIRKQFQFSKSVRNSAESLLSKLRSQNSVDGQSVTLIGVHYRRGDLALKYFSDFGYEMAPLSYIFQAMDHFRSSFVNPLFVVVSDSWGYLKTKVTGKDIVFAEGSSYLTDMATLVGCDHIIISVGTFGWWSAFLNKGTVVYYKHPAREGSAFRAEFGYNYSNFYYPTWIGLE